MNLYFEACKENYYTVIELLLKNNYDINELDEEKNTGLIIATKNNSLDVVKEFLKYNIDLE